VAEVHIYEINCVKKQQALSKDRINVLLDGQRISGPHSMGKGDEVKLNTEHPFTGTAVITVEEEDNNGKGELLGTKVVRDTDGNDSWRVAVFDARPNTYYTLTYHVHES